MKKILSVFDAMIKERIAGKNCFACDKKATDDFYLSNSDMYACKKHIKMVQQIIGKAKEEKIQIDAVTISEIFKLKEKD